jgi:TolB-like protein
MGGLLERFWTELRRRRVIRTAAAYAAGTFVVLQLSEIVLPAYVENVRDVLRLLFPVLAGGFPVVLTLSWIYDLRSCRLRVTSSADARPTGALLILTQSKGPMVSLLAAAAVGSMAWLLTHQGASGAEVPVEAPWIVASLIALLLTGWWAVRGVHAPAESASIAVLPFSDWSVGGQHANFGRALADEVLNLLAGVEGVQVAARISSFALGDSPGDARGVGERLSVSNVLEGSISRDSDRIRVTAQLIDARSGFHRWSRTYRHEGGDPLSAQDQLARSIAGDVIGCLDRPGPLVVS